MYGPFELEFHIDQRHAQALREARVRHLVKQKWANRGPRSGQARLDLAWSTALSVLIGARPAAS